jgi:phenylalanyl-tRNA synthetase beta chain
MRISLEWLKEYVDLTLPPAQLARRITLATAEVEEIIAPPAWEGVSIGFVESCGRIPGSDHLSQCTVRAGDGVHQVVCGAPNVAAGQKIAYAAIGAELFSPRAGRPQKLKPARIMGVESDGMICSELELGLSENHEGILVLPAEAPLGTPLHDYLGDTVLVAGAWAHRADLLAMLGIAREVAALTGQQAREPDLAFEAAGGPIAGTLSIEIADPDLCSRYVAGVVEGVTLGPSPQWMQRRLEAAGVRPINNVVDITNYVMLEFGQPLHAFDYDKVKDQRVIVRRARAGERLTTLDGVDRELTPDMLLITDPDGPIGLAGVMGGANTEISDSTKTILLEAANFNGINIRRTSTRLGLRSEASARFEKQLPAELALRAARRALQLMVELCGGTARQGFIDVYPVPQQPVRIELTAARLRQVLGIEVSTADVTRTLRALGFGCEWQAPDRYLVDVPYWRMDVRIPDDVVEEVIRILGFERLPSTTIAGRIPELLPQPRRVLRERVKDILVAAGAQEIITYAAVSEEQLRKVTPAEDLAILQPLRIVNPLSAEHELMRTTLRGSLLETVRDNLRLRRPALSLFETAVVYLPHEDRAQLPEEREMLVGAICGERLDRWGHGNGEPLDFFDAKGMVEALDERLRAGFSYRAATDPILIEGRTAEIRTGEQPVGVVGQVHPDVLARFDIERDVFLYELNLTALLPLVKALPGYAPVSRFPAVVQDLALVVNEDVPAAELLAAIARSKLVSNVALFDEYRGERIGAGKKSLAFSVSYQAPDRTLTDADAAKEQERILRALAHQFGAELRK